MFLLVSCIASLHACVHPPLPFFSCCICKILPGTFVSYVVSTRAHELPLMNFVLRDVTLHACEFPLAIFVLHVVTLHERVLLLVIFVLHVVTFHTPVLPPVIFALWIVTLGMCCSPPDLFMHSIGIFFVARHQTQEVPMLLS